MEVKSMSTKIPDPNLAFFSKVTSSSGSAAGVKISNASIIIDGEETVLIDDDINLQTNSIDGDNTNRSSAELRVPFDSKQKPEIKTQGNATVKNGDISYYIEISGNPKKLKIKSDKGLFAIIRLVEQRNGGYYYFDILFGKKGETEKLNNRTEKTRPHIAFYPDGNGKFLRLSNYECQLSSVLDYKPEECQIVPSIVEIHPTKFIEKIVLKFEYVPQKKLVILNTAYFESIKT
jgi:hypothetical protein